MELHSYSPADCSDCNSSKYIEDEMLLYEHCRHIDQHGYHYRVDLEALGNLLSAEDSEKTYGSIYTMEAGEKIVGHIPAVQTIPESHETCAKTCPVHIRKALRHAVHIGWGEHEHQTSDNHRDYIHRHIIQEIALLTLGHYHRSQAPVYI